MMMMLQCCLILEPNKDLRWRDAYGPTSSVFGVYGGQGNRGTTDFIAYSWHDVPGLQKFGTYEGNNSTAGNFIELGFRPALIILKILTLHHLIGRYMILQKEIK